MRSRLSRILHAALLAAVALGLTSAPALAQDVFINEFHYDDASTDEGEFVEVAGLAGTDLTDWDIVLYNGNNQKVYDTIDLSGTIPDQDDGCGTLFFLRAGIQNGPADGIALVDDNGDVVEFISYEGSFTAVDGPANGMTSTDIGVDEQPGSGVAAGESLQLSGGPGSDADHFTWQDPADDTPGAVNTGQDFFCMPQVTAEKVDTLEDDVYGDGNFSPGDTIKYTVTITNDDVGARARNVMFYDEPDPKTDLVVGSVTTTKGDILSGNTSGDTAVHVDIGGLRKDRTVTIMFEVVIHNPLLHIEIEEGVENQGEVTGNNFDPVLTHDPDYVNNSCASSNGEEPTYTPLNDICDGVQVTSTCKVNNGLPNRPCEGTPGPDVIIGSEGADVMRGRGGDDTLRGLEGHDLLCGNGGEDLLDGGDGRDQLGGGPGDDILWGVDGNDILDGNGGDDDLLGHGGRDWLLGGPGVDDDLDGGLGRDRCFDLDPDTFIRRCNEGCGLGFELVGLLPALLWARRRRMARA